jgi:chromosome segregation ATPase
MPTTKFKPSEIKAMKARLAIAKAAVKTYNRKQFIPLKSAQRMVEAGVITQADLTAEWVRQPREKPKSRATRCSDACGQLSTAAAELSALVQDVRELEEGDVWKQPTAEQLKDWQERLDQAEGNYDGGKSEIESLKEEIEGWKDNIEEHFSGTDKYNQLEECVSQLESAVDSLEITFPSLPPIDGDFDSFADECETAAQEIEAGQQEAESADFPGMY